MVKVKISGRDTGHIEIDRVDMVMFEKQVRTLQKLVLNHEVPDIESDEAQRLVDMLFKVLAKWDDIRGKIYGEEGKE